MVEHAATEPSPTAANGWTPYQSTNEGEQLVLSFANYEGVVDGAPLAVLLPEITNFHLDCLRDMPAEFHSQADKNEPFVSRVTVRTASDSTERTHNRPENCQVPQRILTGGWPVTALFWR